MARKEEYDRLCRMIQRWNEQRVELFEITPPTLENLEFDGVMKFYFQYTGVDGQKVATKCIRVSSTATVKRVLEVLVQKFRPDLRMLSDLASYALYEVHNDNGEAEERQMDENEKPLMVQLLWGRGDREGRFLFRNELATGVTSKAQKKALKGLGRREKKLMKQEKKTTRKKKDGRRVVREDPHQIPMVKTESDGRGAIARSLYQIYPSSRFTRSITNPDLIKRQWSSSSDKRLRTPLTFKSELHNGDETVQVFANSISTEMQSKSITLSSKDTALHVVKCAVEMFGLKEDPGNFCLVKVVLPPVGGNQSTNMQDLQEKVMDDDECVLATKNNWASGECSSSGRGVVQFQLHRRKNVRKRSAHSAMGAISAPSVPYLIELSHTPTNTPSHNQCKYLLNNDITEIGSGNPASSSLGSVNYINLTSSDIRQRHCMIAPNPSRAGLVITPLDKSALVYVNDKPIKESTPLVPNCTIQLGDKEVYQLVMPPHSSSGQALSSTVLKSNHLGSEFVLNHGLRAKAFSSEDLTPAVQRKPSIPKPLASGRAESEHNLQKDGSGLQQQQQQQQQPHRPSFRALRVRRGSEGQFSSGEESPREGSVTNITPGFSGVLPAMMTSSKKRHNSAPHAGEPPELVEAGFSVLPASLSFSVANEVQLLKMLISDQNGTVLQFKLAPAYALYMVARQHLSPDFVSESERQVSLVHMLKSTCSLARKTVKGSKNIAGSLAFWLANISEFLHFIRRDYRLCVLAQDYENTLTQIIHMAYKNFTEFMVRELGSFLTAFLSESPEADNEDIFLEIPREDAHEPDLIQGPRGGLSHKASLLSHYWSAVPPKTIRRGQTLGDIFATLGAAEALLHLCRVNNMLTSLTFNLLFHYISMRLFNKLVIESKYCTKATGQRLLRRLDKLKTWANKRGLHMSRSADENLGLIFQVAHLLQSPKSTKEDAQKVYQLCPKLNSRQVSAFLTNLHLTDGDRAFTTAFQDEILLLVCNVDQQLQAEGLEVNLQEDPNLDLPFLIPEQGYSCDIMKGVPVGLEEYLEPAIKAGLCRLSMTKERLGCWVPARVAPPSTRESPLSTQASTQMSQTLPRNFPHSGIGTAANSGHELTRPQSALDASEAKVMCITLQKNSSNSLGINIYSGRDSLYQSSPGIFVNSLSEGGPASKDGRLAPGDQIQKVDDTDITGFTREMVIDLLKGSADHVTLTIAKGTAQSGGIALNQPPSPRYPGRKDLETNVQYAPPKEGTSHAKKAARREQRSRQQYSSIDIARSSSSYMGPSGDSHPSSPSHLIPNPNLHTTRWLQEQRDLIQQKPSNYRRLNIPESSTSLSSLIPERDVPSCSSSTTAMGLQHRPSTGQGHFSPYNIPTPPLISTPEPKIPDLPHFGGGRLGSSSKLSEVEFAKYFPHGEQLTSDSSCPGSQMAYRDVSSLSGHQSGSSQAYPSYNMEKLSMEVEYHTQRSMAGLPVTSYLDHLTRKGEKQRFGSLGGGLHASELQEYEADEIDLLKQRMKLLFYEKQKEKDDLKQQQQLQQQQQESEMSMEQLEKPESSTGVKHLMEPSKSIEEDDDTSIFMDPEKFLHITKLRQDLASLRKLISEQRKRCREIHIAKDKEEMGLKQAESRFKAQSSRQFSNYMRPEDEARWQRDQKRRIKEWDRIQVEKKEHLQRIELDEREAKSKLKAYEQHASEIKKQLQACEAQTKNSLDVGSSRHYNSTRAGQDLVESGDWVDPLRPLRVQSIDSITTGSSWISNENPDLSKDRVSLGSEANITGIGDASDVGHPSRTSPSGSHSNSSSPSLVASRWSSSGKLDPQDGLEVVASVRNPELSQNTRLPWKSSTNMEQEERLRLHREDQLHSYDNIPTKSVPDRSQHLKHFQKEGQKTRDVADSSLHNFDKHSSKPSSYWSHHPETSGNYSPYRSFKPLQESFLDGSLSSSTPDVIPAVFQAQAKPFNSHSRQSLSTTGMPHHQAKAFSNRTDHTDPEPSSLAYTYPVDSHPTLDQYPTNVRQASHDIARSHSREGLLDVPEKLPATTSPSAYPSSRSGSRQSYLPVNTRRIPKPGPLASHKYSQERRKQVSVEEKSRLMHKDKYPTTGVPYPSRPVHRQQTEL